MTDYPPCTLSLQRLSPRSRLYFFAAGSTTPKAVYTDPDATVPHPHPIVLGDSGFAPVIYLGAGYYRIRVVDEFGALFAPDFDKVLGAAPAASTAATGAAQTQWSTGDIKPALASGVKDGWVRANGRTIGNAASGAQEAQGETCRALYCRLWAENEHLVVAGGRGPSGDYDFEAGKTLELPDFRGRALFGADNMGASAAARLSTGYGVAHPDVVGSTFGASTVALTVGNLAPHHHTGATDAAPDHSHAGSTANVNGAHYHSTPLATYAADVSAASGTGATARGSLNTVTDTTQGSGEHGHALTIDPDGGHAHNLNINDTGAATPFAILPPGGIVTYYIKL